MFGLDNEWSEVAHRVSRAACTWSLALMACCIGCASEEDVGLTSLGDSTSKATNGQDVAPSGEPSGTLYQQGAASFIADPVLPAITGECPRFADGSFSFGRVTGVMRVGAKKEGGALVFYWPGTSFPASTYTQMGAKNIERVISEGGMIVSIQGRDGQDTDCSITGYYSHDYSQIGQIAACAVKNYGINPRRIYATGCSAGGVTSGCMATRASSYIAAVATNSGGLTSVERIRDSKYAPAVMTMHGGAADFAGLFVTASANLDRAIKNAGGFAINCNHNGGHCAASPQLQESALQFLFDHPYGVSPKPYASGLPSTFPSYCKAF